MHCVLTSVQFNKRFSSCQLRGDPSMVTEDEYFVWRTVRHILVDLYFQGDWQRRIKGTYNYGGFERHTKRLTNISAE